MRKKELIAQLAEREAQIARLEQRIQTMDGLIEGYHSRETAIVNALTHAHETAAEVVEEAEKRAKEILDEAEAAAAETRKRAQTDADGMLEQARSHSAQLLTQAEATVSEYETTIAAYNAALEQAAAEAAANAQRFAAFSRGHKIQPADLTEEVDGLHELPFAPRMDLPDPEGNPAQLMHNIYRIQNRVPPEGGAPAEPPAPPEAGHDAPPAPPAPPAPAGEEPRPGPTAPEEMRTAAPAPQQAEDGQALPPKPPAPLPDDGAEDVPVPTVDGVLPKGKDDREDASLDELLEEIINAGEQYNG